MGNCFGESEKKWFYEKIKVNGFGITGCTRVMLASRISYWLGVNGEFIFNFLVLNFIIVKLLANLQCDYSFR